MGKHLLGDRIQYSAHTINRNTKHSSENYPDKTRFFVCVAASNFSHFKISKFFLKKLDHVYEFNNVINDATALNLTNINFIHT